MAKLLCFNGAFLFVKLYVKKIIKKFQHCGTFSELSYKITTL